ncbi:hypothetical protein CEE44_04435 [Candidatus Woesearchaeota archaeon B3_Woes]|nr:MAG: hypothetical protein CEE44_04435 [Candidatus Woesearchaeota archaeon B3_Woes]
MNKVNVLVISIVFLVVFSFFVVAPLEIVLIPKKSDDIQVKGDFVRENYGMDFDEFIEKFFGSIVTPDDISIDPILGFAFINSGEAVLTSNTGILVYLDGGSADVKEYSGTITIESGGEITGTNGIFKLRKGGTVIVVDGVVQLNNVNLIWNEIDGGIIKGEDVSYDSTTGIMISKKDLGIDDFVYKPKSGEMIYYDLSSQIIDTQGEWVIIEETHDDSINEIKGSVKGFAKVVYGDSILLIASEENPTEFENPKGTKIKVSSDMLVGTNYDDIPSEEISTIIYSSRFKGKSLIYEFYVNAIGNDKIEIETDDGDYDVFVVYQKDDSEIKLVLKKEESNNGVFYFKEGKQLEKGSIIGFETNIIHSFDDSKSENPRGISTPLYYSIVSTPTSLLNKMTGDYGRGLKALARYLYGSGKPMEVDLSDEEWGGLIIQTKGREWTPSTNPEYHADDGWEYMDDIRGGTKVNDAGELGNSADVWNLLGSTTLRRRKVEDGYHYMIAGETFDFKGSASERAYQYFRTVPIFVGEKAKGILGDWVNTKSLQGNNDNIILSVNTQWLHDHGKPFPIVGEYIKKD